MKPSDKRDQIYIGSLYNFFGFDENIGFRIKNLLIFNSNTMLINWSEGALNYDID